MNSDFRLFDPAGRPEAISPPGGTRYAPACEYSLKENTGRGSVRIGTQHMGALGQLQERGGTIYV